MLNKIICWLIGHIKKEKYINIDKTKKLSKTMIKMGWYVNSTRHFDICPRCGSNLA